MGYGNCALRVYSLTERNVSFRSRRFTRRIVTSFIFSSGNEEICHRHPFTILRLPLRYVIRGSIKHTKHWVNSHCFATFAISFYKNPKNTIWLCAQGTVENNISLRCYFSLTLLWTYSISNCFFKFDSIDNFHMDKASKTSVQGISEVEYDFLWTIFFFPVSF